MPGAGTIGGVSKKKKPTNDAQPEEKAVIYLEVQPVLKELMDALAREHNRRLTGECIQALQEWLKQHERWPPKKDEN